MDKNQVARDIEKVVLQSLEKFPVLVLEGARQVGKTTLAQKICKQKEGVYLSLDSMITLEKVRRDPDHMLGNGERFVVIDEIQLLLGLERQVKFIVDNYRRNGMFLLTGSEDMGKMEAIKDALVGRQKTLHMRPFSQFEIFANKRSVVGQSKTEVSTGGDCNVIEQMFADKSPPDKSSEGLAKKVALGGYPAAVVATDKKEVLEEYLFDKIARELQRKNIGERLSHTPRLLRKIAGKIGKIKNIKELAEEIEQAPHVARDLFNLLANTLVLEPLPSLGEKIRKRSVTGKDKIYLNDSGTATTLQQLDDQDLAKSGYWGELLENFVLAELRKHLELSSFLRSASLCYFRENNGIEVDFVLAKNVNKGDLIAIEVKATKNLGRRDRSSLAEFKSLLPDRCKRAILFYGGDKTLRYDDGVEAWPLSSLLEPW